jgi:hypothetical protein
MNSRQSTLRVNATMLWQRTHHLNTVDLEGEISLINSKINLM